MNLTFFKQHKFSPAFRIAGIALAISFVTRIAILLSFFSAFKTSGVGLFGSFAVGFLYDLLIAAFVMIPFLLQITFTNNFIYTAKGRLATIGFFLLLLYLLLFTSVFPKDFNKDLYKSVIIYVAVRFAIVLALGFTSHSFRLKWRTGVLQFFFFITTFILLFNAVSEWFFWNEFSSRYNFIAVDYLVYTNEVIGNIQESYPVYKLITLVAIIAGVITYWCHAGNRFSVHKKYRFANRLATAPIILFVPAVLMMAVHPDWKNFSSNNFTNELAGNGVYDFVQAFKNNELDFYKYYNTLPDEKAFAIVREQLSAPNTQFTGKDPYSIERTIKSDQPELHKNVVLISVESLSASFMQSFGNNQNLTPYMDSLAKQGLLFTNLYASGTRTVRGLEALSLSIPPTPGQSLVKRPQNEHLFSLGSVFKSKGYITQYIYGGYGYFDNMNYFFGNNDYDVIDRTQLADKDIHYSNIWGVADEDLFTLALHTMDDNYAKGKPFFSHVMTVSNHRPFTYPDGRIDIPASSQCREGAVKYTDYAIGTFIKQASQKPWFNNTVFVIVADHCASSAGSTALPVTGYHIPMIMYAPGFIAPQKAEMLTAQIDIAPTLLGLLHFNYTSNFFGQDVFNVPAEKQRAFISTYQGLGYIKNNELVVQMPVKKIKTYKPDFNTGDEREQANIDSLTQQAIAQYQVAAWLIKHKKFVSKKHS